MISTLTPFWYNPAFSVGAISLWVREQLVDWVQGGGWWKELAGCSWERQSAMGPEVLAHSYWVCQECKTLFALDTQAISQGSVASSLKGWGTDPLWKKIRLVTADYKRHKFPKLSVPWLHSKTTSCIASTWVLWSYCLGVRGPESPGLHDARIACCPIITSPLSLSQRSPVFCQHP